MEIFTGKNIKFDEKTGAALSDMRKVDRPLSLMCDCGGKVKSVCSYCRLQGYCSKECQKFDWARHKLVCMPCIGSYEKGYVAVFANPLPAVPYLQEILGEIPSAKVGSMLPMDLLAVLTQGKAYGMPVAKVKDNDILMKSGSCTFHSTAFAEANEGWTGMAGWSLYEGETYFEAEGHAIVKSYLGEYRELSKNPYGNSRNTTFIPAAYVGEFLMEHDKMPPNILWFKHTATSSIGIIETPSLKGAFIASAEIGSNTSEEVRSNVRSHLALGTLKMSSMRLGQVCVNKIYDLMVHDLGERQAGLTLRETALVAGFYCDKLEQTHKSEYVRVILEGVALNGKGELDCTSLSSITKWEIKTGLEDVLNGSRVEI